ncbi:pyridine nucleotide-disulfide oxidoreductase [Microbacterium sp. SZ1]|uniref:NAD(P)/FAD-dependent oxidoreductase n=1 Tax=Microbacterium sp. SZ1 TaxID=1849736 RepID=UPI000BBBD300|nr:FAD/NAD(P)-binding oxidoreductase [Microbacterium sp. SZ1]PCE15845.1 pyridine nucleotide-disulfide oxidoreductase [Microbacterium sp. SZ1]
MSRSASNASGSVVIVGGGNAGVSIAARLRRRGVADVTIIEPRQEHVYAPLQSHIAGGVADRREVVRPQAKVTPRGVTWVRDRVVSVLPAENSVELSSGERIRYDQLIVAAGIEQRWDAIPGLQEAAASASVVSNYTLDLADAASTALRDLDSGTVVFTQAAEPASCAGVAQKPMYLACDRWRKRGVLDRIRVVFVTPESSPFHIEAVASELRRSLDAYGIETFYDATVVGVRSEASEIDIVIDGQTTTLGYDVLHASPPQAAAGWIAESGLHGDDGFVDVDRETLRHRRWDNIWALGDVAALTRIRSGGAIRSQAKIIADALTRPRRRRRYDGYSETPFTVTGRTAVFAEFDRHGRLQPSIPWWRTLYRERRFTYLMDRRVLPWVYWNLILRGRA